MGQKRNFYTVYKGDNIIANGTLGECAAQLQVKPNTILFYGTPTYKKRTSCYSGRRLERGV